MKALTICFLAALLLLATLRASAVNYYVDPSSSGSNSGTFTDPWKSLNDIPATINYFLPGDTVFFKRGQQFTGTLSINSTGSDGSPIVFMPYGSGSAPVFQYNLANPTDPLSINRMIIRLNQVNYIVIDGFVLTDATIPDNDHTLTANVGYGVYIYSGPGNNGSYNTIKNVTVSNVGTGVTIDGGTHNTITNCVIRNSHMVINTPDISWDDNGALGITLGGSDNTITHNIIQGCWGGSYDYQYDGGAIEMYGYSVNNNTILYNTAIDNMGWMEFGSGSGGQALNNLVGYNLLINNGDVFWINSGNGFAMDVRNLQLFNNNVIETTPPRLAVINSLIGIFSTPSVPNVISMKNNIFWLTSSLNITDPKTQPFNGPQLVHQNNLYHMSGGSQGYILDASELNLKSGDSLFMNSTSFGSPDLWNYNLRPSCAAVNFGQNVGIYKDFFGNNVPVSSAPDAGIAEHTSLGVLPLQILSCKGWAGTNGNNIEWVTTNDSANHFEVERSNGGNNFKTIAVVPAKMNAGSTVQYQYVDNDVTDGVQYYRIKAIKQDNAEFYSQIVSINNSLLPENLTASPNPVQGSFLYLRIPGNDFLNKEMVMVNMAGVEVRNAKINDANSRIKVNVGMLPRGAYVIKLIDYKSGKYYKTIFTK